MISVSRTLDRRECENVPALGVSPMLVRLYDVVARCLIESSLVPMTMDHVTRAKQTWVDEFQRRQSSSLRDEDVLVWTHGLMSDLSPADHLPPQGYVVLQDDEIQGFVVFDEFMRPSLRMPNTCVLYLKYLATAPWNRRNRDNSGRFRHVGRI